MEKTNQKLGEIIRSTFRWPSNNQNRKNETVLNRIRIGRTKFTHGFSTAKESPLICTTHGTHTQQSNTYSLIV